MKVATLMVGALALLVGSGPAFAHITLKQRKARPGAAYEAVLNVGHGCEGSPTTAIRVRIPDGIAAVEAIAKPGWRLEARVGTSSKLIETAGGTPIEAVREIVWSGGSLPDGTHDVFVFRSRLPESPAGTAIYFPVVQECTKGINRWIDIPESGSHGSHGGHGHDEGSPAPYVTLSTGQ